MFEYLPPEIREGLAAAERRDLRRRSRLRLHAGDAIHPILRYWEDGFALDAETAPNLRGLVDIYDGTRHLCQCLIVTSTEENRERVFEFKRNTAAVDAAPIDYARDPDAPAGLLSRD